MNKEQLLSLEPKEFQHTLTTEEFIHMAKTLGAFWSYDYEAVKKGKVGMHAELKSGLHSDGFFVSKILLEPENIREIITNQMILKIDKALNSLPDAIAGIPDSATRLGEDIAKKFGVRNIKMEKIDGKISLVDTRGLTPVKYILLIEDVCTRGTGLIEAFQLIHNLNKVYPSIKIIPLNPVILSRGGLQIIHNKDFDDIKIIAVAEYKMNDWEPNPCPLCKMGSIPIKPKATDENWRDINMSQL
jgi:orotate phosphoribosyltransferase